MTKKELKTKLGEFDDAQWIEESCTSITDCKSEFQDMDYAELVMWAAQSAVVFNEILNEVDCD